MVAIVSKVIGFALALFALATIVNAGQRLDNHRARRGIDYNRDRREYYSRAEVFLSPFICFSTPCHSLDGTQVTIDCC